MPGRDLRRLIRNQGKLTVAEAAGVIMQSLEAYITLINRTDSSRYQAWEYFGDRGRLAKLSDLGLSGFVDNDIEDPELGK